MGSDLKKLKQRFLNLETTLAQAIVFLALLLFGLSLGWVVSNMPSPLGSLIAGSLLAVSFFVVWRGPLRHARLELRATVFALLVRFTIVLYVVPVVRAFYISTQSDDTVFYLSSGQQIAGLIMQNPLGALQMFFGTVSLPMDYRWVWGIFYLLSGGSYAGIAVFHAWFAALGIYYFLRAFQPYLPAVNWRWYVFLVSFFPSILFWTTYPVKDALVLWSLGLLSYGFSLYTRGQIWPGLGCLLVGELACFAIRPYFAAFFSIPLLAIGLVQILRTIHRTALGNPGGNLILVLTNAFLFLFLVSSNFGIGVEMGPGVFDELEGFQQAATVGGSAIRPPTGPSATVQPPTGPSATVQPPTGPSATVQIFSSMTKRISFLIAVLFRPFPWEAHNRFALFASLENMALVLLMIGTIVTLRITTLEIIRKPIFIFVFLYAVLFVAAFSFQVGNLGTMVRVKATVLPFILVFTSFLAESLPVLKTAR